jgi:hypothetical protein
MVSRENPVRAKLPMLTPEELETPGTLLSRPGPSRDMRPYEGARLLELGEQVLNWRLKTPYNRPEGRVFASPHKHGAQPY